MNDRFTPDEYRQAADDAYQWIRRREAVMALRRELLRPCEAIVRRATRWLERIAG